jgi:hypothetical protein
VGDRCYRDTQAGKPAQDRAGRHTERSQASVAFRHHCDWRRADRHSAAERPRSNRVTCPRRLTALHVADQERQGGTARHAARHATRNPGRFRTCETRFRAYSVIAYRGYLIGCRAGTPPPQPYPTVPSSGRHRGTTNRNLEHTPLTCSASLGGLCLTSFHSRH